MKVNIILNKSHYTKFPKQTANIIKNFSEKNNIFFNEYLNSHSIKELNNCDIILARHDLNKKVIDEINVPIIIANERLFLPNYLEPLSFHYKWSMKHLFKAETQ